MKRTMLLPALALLCGAALCAPASAGLGDVGARMVGARFKSFARDRKNPLAVDLQHGIAVADTGGRDITFLIYPGTDYKRLKPGVHVTLAARDGFVATTRLSSIDDSPAPGLARRP